MTDRNKDSYFERTLPAALAPLKAADWGRYDVLLHSAEGVCPACGEQHGPLGQSDPLPQPHSYWGFAG